MAEIDRNKVMSWLEGLAEDDWRLFHSDSEVSNIAKAALALMKEKEEAKTIICPKCGDEIEIKLSLLIKPDMEAITQGRSVKRDE